MQPEPTPEKTHQRTDLAPVLAGVLIGGASTRMGSPKHLLRAGGQTFLETVLAAVKPHVERVVILGVGELPERCRQLKRLPDVPGLAGPLGGILAAMRWNRNVAWLIAACDMPLVTSDAVAWLLAQRAPDHIAVLPRIREGEAPAEPVQQSPAPREGEAPAEPVQQSPAPREGEAPAEPDVTTGPRAGRSAGNPTVPPGSAGASPSRACRTTGHSVNRGRTVEPLLAIYEPAALPALEALAASKLRAPHRMAEHGGVFTPTPPVKIASAWRNVNTPAELPPARSRHLARHRTDGP